MSRFLALMIAPISPENGRTVDDDIAGADAWYRFLREVTADMPITIIAPWLVGILLGDDESDPAQRERALVDSETVAARCDLTIAVGYTRDQQLSAGMAREESACPGPCVDLLYLGREYDDPRWMSTGRREEIREQIGEVIRAHRSVRGGRRLEEFAEGAASARDEVDPDHGAAVVAGIRVHPSNLTTVIDVADDALREARSHVRALLAIIDEVGGYMTTAQQAAIRAAREEVPR